MKNSLKNSPAALQTAALSLNVVRGFSLASLLFLSLLTPAWAGQGWYLMAPPIGEKENSLFANSSNILIEAPLQDWKQLQAFDTAKECEIGKQDSIRASVENTKKKLNSDNTLTNMFLNSLCIASDDPRLKGR